MQNKQMSFLKVVVIMLSVTGASIIIFYTNKSKSVDSQNMSNVSQGEQLYQQYCATCHGEKLEGQPNWKTRNERGRLPAPPHDETGHIWHHADQLLFELTKFGMVPPNAPEGYESDMPAYKDTLTDEQIWAVLNYIKSRWPEETQKIQRETTSRSTSFKKP